MKFIFLVLTLCFISGVSVAQNNTDMQSKMNHAKAACLNKIQKELEGKTEKEVVEQLEPLFYNCIRKYGFDVKNNR